VKSTVEANIDISIAGFSAASFAIASSTLSATVTDEEPTARIT
jgi:hypothetical protein